MEDRFDVDLTLFGETTTFAVWRYTGTEIERWRAAGLRPGPDGTYESCGYGAFEQQLTPHDALGKAVARLVGHRLGDRFALTQRAARREDRSIEVSPATPVGTATSVKELTVPPEPVKFVTRQERSVELSATIDDAIERLAEQLSRGHTEEFLRTLAFYGKFHRYSWQNCMLIAAQCPAASVVAGMKTWNKQGYRVRPGETAIWVWAPITRKEFDAATGEEREVLLSFKPAPVWDVSQLAGLDERPLPEFAPALPDDVGPVYDEVKRRVERTGIRVVESPMPSGTFGVSLGGEIRVRAGLDSRSRLFTLIHEVVHEIEHRREGQEAKTTQQREFEAESVTFVVAAALGLEQPHSADYLLQYRSTPEQLRASLGTIQSLIRRVLAIVQPDQRRVEQLAA